MVLMKANPPSESRKCSPGLYQPSLNPVKSQEACEFKSADKSFVFPGFLLGVGVVQGFSYPCGRNHHVIEKVKIPTKGFVWQGLGRES